MLRKLLILTCALVLSACGSLPSFAPPKPAHMGAVSGVQVWEAQPGYANSVQAQLNTLFADFAQVSPILPPNGTPGQFVIQTAPGTGPGYFTISGDVSCSIAVPGLCTVSGLSGVTTINTVNVNGAINPATLGTIAGATVGSTTDTGTIGSASKSLTLTSGVSFLNGMGIAIPGAGGAPTPVTPSQAVAVATCPTGACATGYVYQVVAEDMLCGSTIASPASASVNNNATLDQAHYNTIAIPMEAGVESWEIFRGTTPVAIIPASEVSNSTETSYWRDVGQSAVSIVTPCLAATPPIAATKQALYTTIASGGGTTNPQLTAATSTGVTGVTVYHDDAFAVNLAFSSTHCNTTYGCVVAMPATAFNNENVLFVQSQPIVIGSVGGGISHAVFLGTGQGASLNSLPMMQGLPMIKSENNFQPRIGPLVVTALGAVAAVQFDVNNPHPPGSGAYVGEGSISGLDCSTAGPVDGVAFTASLGYDQNDSENSINGLNCNASMFGVWFGHTQNLQNRINGGNISGTLAAVGVQGGSFSMVQSVLASTYWLFSFETGGTTHDINITGVHAETNAALLRVDAGFGPGVENIIGIFDSDLGVNDTGTGNTMIDFETTNMSLSMAGDHFGEGVTDNWTDDALSTLLVANRWNIGTITGTSKIVAINNSLVNCPTLSLTGGGYWSGANNITGGVCLAVIDQLTNLNAETFLGTTSGSFQIAAAAIAGTGIVMIPPITNGSAGQPRLGGAGSAADTWGTATVDVPLSAGSNTFGNNTPFPTGTPIISYIATNAGHFTNLTCANLTLNGGSCTTAPIVNVVDATSAGAAPLSCLKTVQALGTVSSGAQTLPFAAGDVISIEVSTQGATCLAPIFAVSATAVEVP